MRAVLILALLLGGTATAQAQDSRPPAEPRLPPTCLVLSAPLRSDSAAPVAGGTPASEDAESSFETAQLNQALARCPQGQAVELTLGPTPADNAFLLNPVTLPAGVSLIIDGGVTVYASRNPRNFQNPSFQSSAEPKPECGTVGPGYPVDGICLPLFTLSSQSGIYGYGVLDGQGHRGLIRNGQFSSGAWWDLLDEKKNKSGGCASGAGADGKPASSCEQASPPMISAGELSGNQAGTDLTLFGITIRNPPFHTVRLGGTGMTVWGVKVQAPWNVPNSDGFDVRGQDILIRDVTVANGDQDIAITSVAGQLTSRMTIEGLTAYGKGGVALLGGGAGITDLLVRNMAMTGDVPSFVIAPWQVNGEPTALINGVDVRTATLRGTSKFLASYGQALPTATNEIQGLQINSNINANSDVKVVFRNITFRDVCLQDVVRPIHVGPLTPFSGSAPAPVVENILFHNVHVLRPTVQFPEMKAGVVTPHKSGTYSAAFEAYPAGGMYNHLTFQNLVFDDLASGSTSLATLLAVGNKLSTRQNVYPAALNDWANTTAPPPAGWTLQDNSYDERTTVSQPALALPCPAARWPFLLGDLYLSRGARAVGNATNRRHLTVEPWQSVTLNAVVQPAMSQTTWFRLGSYGADPGLLAVGAPALTNAIEFHEGDRLVGLGHLGANGTLATATVGPLAPGIHTYTARYPGDVYYKPFTFGAVTVSVQ